MSLISKRTHCFSCAHGELKRANRLYSGSISPGVILHGSWVYTCNLCSSRKIIDIQTGTVEYAATRR